MIVNEKRPAEPMLPWTTSPTSIPIRARKGPAGSEFRVSLEALSASRPSSAARTAVAYSNRSVFGSGTGKNITTASPTCPATCPPAADTGRVIVSKKAFKRATRRSASNLSVVDVKSIMSQ